VERAELDKIVADHSLWLDSRGDEGQRADFSGADLSRADLRGANLYGVDFSRANLTGANLSAAFLSRAKFSAANLTGGNLVGAFLSTARLGDADLSGANLSGANLSGANLSGADLSGANLSDANLIGAFLSPSELGPSKLIRADISGADLTDADLVGADFSRADLSRANLIGANLSDAHLSRARLIGAHASDAHLSRAKLGRADLRDADLRDTDLSGADLRNADLAQARLLGAGLRGADLSGARVGGVSASAVKSDGATRWRDLVLTPEGQPVLTTDDLELAQFIHLMLCSQKIRNVLEAITSRVVLVLGSFEPNFRCAIDAVKERLREQNGHYIPVVFDFGPPPGRDIVDTVKLLAAMARFVVVDLSYAQAAMTRTELGEIMQTVTLPVAPVMLLGNTGADIPDVVAVRRKYPHLVLPTFKYRDIAHLIAELDGQVLRPAEEKVRELRTARP